MSDGHQTADQQVEIHDAAVARMKADTRKIKAEEAKFFAEETKFLAETRKLDAQTALLKVQRERTIQDLSREIATTSKLAAEEEFYRSRADAQQFATMKDRELRERVEQRRREEEAEKS